ncbi:MAG TPA: polysaccharide lyase family 7 protein [Candidatus Saccharimonadales bacterium]|jgi:poly(beta-D-mannuronate) lyase|nr:polysaccharide lyase family 7 protein [Candidatus Saccharimonadales bacterium]
MNIIWRQLLQPARWIKRQPLLALLAMGGAVLVGVTAVVVFVLPHGNSQQTGSSTRSSGRVGGASTSKSSSNGTSSTKDALNATSPAAHTPAAANPAPAPPQPTPSSVLGLTGWRLTLPVDTAHNGSPDEIDQPELAGFVSSPYFELTPAKNGVIFQANAGGATTKNSGYPRSELREMTANGATEASWSNATGTHTMVVREAITHLPAVKPEVVAAQIHNASDDVIMVKLSGNHLFVEANSKNIGDLDTNYALGTVYTIRIVAGNGRIQAYYNDVLKADYAKSGSGLYFKAGCYTQSNVSKGDAPDAFAQVIIYSVQVSHV